MEETAGQQPVGTATPPGQQPPTRRERQRQETMREIVAVSRTLLRTTEDPLSISAVAAEMGMTAPALYRYVGSHQGLLMLVTGAVLVDVGDDIRRARDTHPDSDPAGQIIAASCAFRGWALANRREFALVFASAEGDTGKIALSTATPDGVAPMPEITAFTEVFSAPFERLWTERRFPLVDESHLDPGTLAALSADSQCMLPGTFPAQPIGLTWHFLRCWARLYGVVTLEAFSHVDPAFVASASLFLDTLDQFAGELGMVEDWEAVREDVRRRITTAPPTTDPTAPTA